MLIATPKLIYSGCSFVKSIEIIRREKLEILTFVKLKL